MKEETNANRKLGAAKARELIAAANKVIVMKGKKVTSFDLKAERPDVDQMLVVMLGTTGNLRAPTIVRGKTVLVGFNQEIYDQILG